MAHGDAREGKWRWNWRMEWVASTLHTTSEHGVSSITTADAHSSAASSRLNWRPCRFKWTRSFRRKTKSGFCAFAIISNAVFSHPYLFSLDTAFWVLNSTFCANLSRHYAIRCLFQTSRRRHHHVHEGLGVFPVPWSSRWSWPLHLFLGHPMFLRPFGLYCSASFGSLFVSVLCTCCSHFFWYCFFLLLCSVLPFSPLIHWLFSLSSFVIPSKVSQKFHLCCF